MSIIHDALKKVQEKNAKEPQARTPDASAVPAASGPVQAAVPAGENRIIIALLGILILAILIFAVILNVPRAQKIRIQAAQVTPSPLPVNAAPQAAPSAAPAEPKASAEPAVLQPQADPNDPLLSVRVEGIMDMGGGKRVALLNGNIYEEGQTIYGRKIEDITIDSVTIVDNGTQRVLPVNPPKP